MQIRNPQSKIQNDGDSFDRLYYRWAEHARGSRQAPPSREVWDKIVLRLILSEDPQRVRLYRRIEAQGPDTLGADAYDLWRKMPEYTANLTAPVKTRDELRAYAEAHRGSMRRLMEEQGLGERYNEIVETQERLNARVRSGQTSVITIGCIGLSLIAFMMLTVLLIIAIRLGGGG